MSVNTTGRLCSMISAIHNHPLPKYTLFLFSFGKKISIFVISSGLFSANVCTALLTNDIAHSRPFTKSHLITYQKKVLLYTPFSLLSKWFALSDRPYALTLLWSYPSYLKCFLDTLCPHNVSADLHANSGNSIANKSGHFFTTAFRISSATLSLLLVPEQYSTIIFSTNSFSHDLDDLAILATIRKSCTISSSCW